MSKEDPQRKKENSPAGTNTGNSYVDASSSTEEQTNTETILEEAGITRRQFVSAAAATAGALTLGGPVTAEHTSEKTDALYEFIQTHTAESDYRIQTLIRLDDTAGQTELDALAEEWNEEMVEDAEEDEDEDGDDVDEIEFIHTTEPEIASYVRLTADQSEDVIELDTVQSLEFSPGANPFWQLGKYDDGVFPSPDDSVHFIAYDEMIAGIEYLADEYSDQLNFHPVGQSVGHHNLLTGEVDRNDVWVLELTNNVDDDESFTEKEKAIFSFSIHGDERTGAEAGCRMIESILEGDEPDVDENLDDLAILGVFPNPDGWVVRQPQYIGVLNNYHRENAAGTDLNRSYPAAGFINPSHYPSDPLGQNLEDDQPGEVDNDIPARSLEHSSSSLGVVEWLRAYENIDTFTDLHGMGTNNEFVFGLVPNSNQFNHLQQHDTYELYRRVGADLDAEFDPIEEYWDDLAPGLARFHLDPDDPEDREENLPTRLYDFGTWRDTLGYTASGDITSWAAVPEEFGGLEAIPFTPEVILNNKSGGIVQEYRPALSAIQVQAYESVIRTVIMHTLSSIDAELDSGGRNTAVVHTDTLTQSSDDLVFADTEMVGTSESVEVASGGTETVTFEVSEQANQITVNIDHEQSIYATLHDPNDDQIKEYDSVDENGRGAEWCITDPVSGEWTVTIEHRGDDDEDVNATVRFDALLTDNDDVDTSNGEVLTPDPVEVLGYEQREYEATPFQYLQDYGDALNEEGNFEFVSIQEVDNGALTDSEGSPAYENVVLIHDEGIDDLVDGLNEYVEAGGNLVLTDAGVLALSQLDAVGADSISDDDLTVIQPQYPELDPAPQDPDADEDADELPSRDLDHPLLENTRWFSRELYTLAGIGYGENEAPATVVDPDAFEEGDGRIAARTENEVSVGTLGATPTETGDGSGGIQLIGTLVPPPGQRNLHPFGLLDYGVEFLGHTIMTNALGYEQYRFVDGEMTDLWREQETATPDPN